MTRAFYQRVGPLESSISGCYSGPCSTRHPKKAGSGRAPSINVLGGALQPCSTEPLTGFYRDGCCNTGREDVGLHTVCVVLTAAFLAFSKAQGNDLATPMPQYGFAGLKPGDRWCLCAARWKEALDAGAAPAGRARGHPRGDPAGRRRSSELKKYAVRLQ